MSKEKALKIREAQEADAAIIALLGRITFTETFGHLFRDPQDLLDYHDRTFSVEKIHSSLQKSNNHFLLAFYEDLPVAYAKLKYSSYSSFIQSTQVAQLQKIYVLKDFLSMKIGLALQKKLVKKAKEADSEYIWLSVYRENERAIKFYQKNKFEKIGEHDYSIGQEDFHFLVMAKEL